MTLHDKIGYLLLGMAIGFVFGYIVRALREIKDELDEVDAIVKGQAVKNDDGLVRYPLVLDFALLLVIAMVVYASFATARTNNDLKENVKSVEGVQSQLKDQQASIVRLASCNRETIMQLTQAINERTEANDKRAEANLTLQKAQTKFLQVVVVKPPVDEDAKRKALLSYVDALEGYVKTSESSKDAQVEFPYPTEADLEACYSAANRETEAKKIASENE